MTLNEDKNAYSKAFDKHVTEGDDDVLGLLSYALYKVEKREWLTDKKAKGLAPSRAEKQGHEEALCTETQLQRRREQVHTMLAGLVSAELENLLPVLEEDWKQTQFMPLLTSIHTQVLQQRKKVWQITLEGLLGNVAFTVLLIGTVIVAKAINKPFLKSFIQEWLP
jgi:hypothetical protein